MTANRLWQYALTVYEQPRVRTSCLALQDQQGVNVCVILTVAWLAALGRRCTPEVLNVLLSGAEPWDAVLQPLREARRALRGQSEMLYVRAKHLELAVERQLLAVLAYRVEADQLPALPPAQAFDENLALLAAQYGSVPDRDPHWQQLKQALAE